MRKCSTQIVNLILDFCDRLLPFDFLLSNRVTEMLNMLTNCRLASKQASTVRIKKARPACGIVETTTNVTKELLNIEKDLSADAHSHTSYMDHVLILKIQKTVLRQNIE